MLFLCSFLAFSFLSAIDYSPWTERILELELRPEYTYSSYRKIDTVNGDITLPDNPHLLTLSSIIMPTQRWQLQFESGLSKTKEHNMGFSHATTAVRFLWLHDVIGDPISLMTGVNLTFSHSSTQNNLSLFRHGEIEIEGDLSIGKECTYGCSWLYRNWAALIIGQGSQGFPWLGIRAESEWNYCETHFFFLETMGRMGLGKRALDLNTLFTGYSNIAYRTLDIGCGYCLKTKIFPEIEASYRYRVIATNSPKEVHRILFSINYPLYL